MYLIYFIEKNLPLSTLKVECPWFSTISSKKKKFYWKCLFVLPSSTQYMQLSLLLFLHNLLCFHLSRALGSCCLSLVPLCGSIPPAGPLHWFSSWQYPGIRVPLCHRLIHEPGFKIHSFYSGGIFSEVLKSKPEGFQACFTSWSELKYFLSCSLVVSSFLQLFSYFFWYSVYYIVNLGCLHLHSTT